MLKWIERVRVNKENGHYAFIDRFYDTDTMVEYYCYGDNNLTVRVNSEGRPYRHWEVY